MTDAVKRAKELDEQLPPRPWAVEGTSAGRADVVDATGNWIADIRKDFSEDDQPLLIELRNEVLPALVAEVERYRSAVLPGRAAHIAQAHANSGLRKQNAAEYAPMILAAIAECCDDDRGELLDIVRALTANAGLDAIRIRQLREQLASCEKALEEQDARILELTGAFKWTSLVGFRCQHCANMGERKTCEIEVADTRVGKRYVCKICGAGGMMSDHDAPVAQVPEWRAIDLMPRLMNGSAQMWMVRGPACGLILTRHPLLVVGGTECRPVDSEGVPVPWASVGL